MPEEGSAAAIESAYRDGGRAFLRHLPLLLVLGLAVSAARLATVGWVPGRIGVVSLALLLLVVIPLQWGYALLCLRAVRQEEVVACDMLRPFDRYTNTLIAIASVHALVLLGLVLLVVPGIYFYCRTRFVPYLVLQENLEATEALSTSWEMTEGHVSGQILGITLVGWVLTLLGFLLAGLGVTPALIWWELALASYYQSVLASGDESVESAALYAE